jgi:guanidinoacetate N-methyltransferase
MATSMFGDIRDITYKNRLNIGFVSDYSRWREAPAQFSNHALEINGHPIMEDWEAEYMRVLADIACSKGGIILEIGFGMGISARFMQSHNIDEHLIIESNRDVFKTLTDFAAISPTTIRPLYGFWQELTPSLLSGSLNGILFG